MTLKEIEELIITARANGVDEIKMEGLRIKFRSKSIPTTPTAAGLAQNASEFFTKHDTLAAVPDVKAEDLIKPLNPLDDLTPEEILYYAVPHYDQIQAEKEEHKKKLEDEKINGG